jgi:hypothetical protein
MLAEISLSYTNIREAEAVVQAVSPDNVNIPTGLAIKTTKKGRRVWIQIVCVTRLQTLMATIDDLLSAVSIAERAISAISNR